MGLSRWRARRLTVVEWDLEKNSKLDQVVVSLVPDLLVSCVLVLVSVMS